MGGSNSFDVGCIRCSLDQRLKMLDAADLAIILCYTNRYLDGFSDHESTRIDLEPVLQLPALTSERALGAP